MNILGNNESEVFTLKRIYFEIREEFGKYVKSKFTHTYYRSVTNHLKKIFIDYDVKDVTEMRKLINSGKIHQKCSALSIRVILNYCEENELMGLDEIDMYRRRIKIASKEHIDNFVPKDEQIFNNINKLNQIVDKKKLLIYRFMLETTCRWSEAVHFFENFDEQKLEIRGEVCAYSNFYKKGKKSSFYLMFTSNLYNELKPLMKEIKKSDLIYIRRKSQREPDLLNLKYLRKYTFTLMLMKGVPVEIANLISGRSTRGDVGLTHYADKKELMFQQYPKILPKMNKLVKGI